MPFLEVITRTFGKRPAMLARNLESLTLQTDSDWCRTVLVDDNERGVAWAVGNLATVEATGDYVWVLDDDDLCCRPTLVAELKDITERIQPDVIMVKAYHAKFGMLPSMANWTSRPVLGNIGTSCYIVRRDVWNAHHDAWTERYDGDFWFIDHLWDAQCSFYWHPVTAAYYPQQSIGAGE